MRLLFTKVTFINWKVDVIEKSKKNCDVDLDNKENILPLKTVNIGFEAEGTISKLIASDMLNYLK